MFPALLSYHRPAGSVATKVVPATAGTKEGRGPINDGGQASGFTTTYSVYRHSSRSGYSATISGHSANRTPLYRSRTGTSHAATESPSSNRTSSRRAPLFGYSPTSHDPTPGSPTTVSPATVDTHKVRSPYHVTALDVSGADNDKDSHAHPTNTESTNAQANLRYFDRVTSTTRATTIDVRGPIVA